MEKLSAATSGPTARNGGQSAAWCVQMLPSLCAKQLPHPISDFRMKGEALRRDFVVLTSRHSDCLGFPFDLPFVVLPPLNTAEQSHSSSGWL